MLAKYWKKICIFILIVACIFNVMMKLIKKVSLNTELSKSVKYLQTQYDSQENHK